MNFSNPFFPRHHFVFKGGASVPAGPVAAPPAPPPSESSIEVTQAKIDEKKKAKNRQGINSTLLAGDMMPAQDAGNPGGKTTLLGGG